MESLDAYCGKGVKKLKNVKRIFVLLTIVFFCLSNPTSATASGGSKTTSFTYSTLGLASLFVADVYFSWDSDTWLYEEEHEIGLTIDVKDVNEQVINLTVYLREIQIRLKSEKVYGGTETILTADLTGQITTLYYMFYGGEIIDQSQSFSYTVQAPQSILRVSNEESVKIYYVIALDGYYYFEKDSTSGQGYIGDIWLSNEGTIHGGIEDPVWITLKTKPSIFLSPYVIGGIIGAIITVAITTPIFLWLRKRKEASVEETVSSSEVLK